MSQNSPSETEKKSLYTTFSQVSLHRACPQKFNYRHIRGLQPIFEETAPVEKDFGSWWHALRAADSIERGLAKGSLQWVPRKLKTTDDGPTFALGTLADLYAQHEHEGEVVLSDWVLREADAWWKTLSTFEKDAWEERMGGHVGTRLRYLDAEYRSRWSREREHEEPLAVELFWRRELPTVNDPATGTVTDPDSAMLGFIDEVYFDRRRNLVVARDHKTHKSLGTQSAGEDMMDSQLQIYTWGASKAISQWGYGPVKATAFDRIRTAPAKKPKITQAGTLSKAVSDYDLTTYLTWAKGPDGEGMPFPGRKKDGSEAGLYQAEEKVIEKLSDPAALSAWQQRSLQPVNRNIITTHLRSAVDSTVDIARTRARAAVTMEAPRNFGRQCSWCDFASLCRAEMTGGPEGEYDLAAMKLRERPAKK